ncbi:MAG TPA: hypothetical protein VIZ64_02035, partial [Dokdonella sp.]
MLRGDVAARDPLAKVAPRHLPEQARRLPDRAPRGDARRPRSRISIRSVVMLRKLILASALVAGTALAQQNVDISGADFQSGGADSTLADLGRKSAASSTRLIITAPPEWHARIASKVRAGGAADLVLREGFYENVLVRVQSRGAETAAEPARAEAERSRAEVERAKAEAEKSRAEAAKAKAEAEKLRAEAERARFEA